MKKNLIDEMIEAGEYRPKYHGNPFITVCDLVNKETNKTYRESNLEKNHTIPIGTLVEVKFDSWFGDGACWKIHARLWVVSHDRDCDGTPLYALSRWSDPYFGKTHDCYDGFSEESLEIVSITPDLIRGEGALEWTEAEMP